MPGQWTATTGGPTAPDGAPLAGLGARLGARILDWIIITILSTIAAFPWIADMARVMQDWLDDVAAGNPADVATLLNNTALLDASQRVQFTSLVVSAVYVIGFISWRGATPGKMATGVRVRPIAADGKVSGGQAFLRWLSREGLSAVPLIGFFYLIIDSVWPLWDPRRQALHDKAARTVVVRAR